MSMMGTATTSFGPNVLQDMYLEQQFVMALRARLVVQRLGKPSTLPENQGKNVRWQFFSNPTAKTSSLTEGGTPPSTTDWTTSKAEATLQEYGGYTEFSKFLLKTGLSATQEEIAKGLGDEAAITIDRLNLDELTTGTPVQVDAGGGMTVDYLRQCAAKLQQAGQTTPGGFGPAKPHPASPGGQYYIAALSAEAAYDMLGEGTPTWSQVKNDQIESNLRTPFEDTPASAAAYGCIVKISDNIQRDTTTSPDDDLNYVFGADAFGVAALDTNVLDPSLIIIRPEQRTDKPLQNSGTAGWWLLYAVKVIDTLRYVELLSDATGIG